MNPTIKNNRLQNLELLIREAGTATQLARVSGTSRSYLSQLRHRQPSRSGKPRKLGDVVAEKLERGMGKPEGWMDECHLAVSPHKSGEADLDAPAYHPLISWAQACEWPDKLKCDAPATTDKLFICPVACSDDAYVLQVHGISMEPKFHDGELIFVDPNVTPVHGTYVVARLTDSGEVVFKQFIVEGDTFYLRALNPAWPNPIIEITPTITICGAVIFKGEALPLSPSV